LKNSQPNLKKLLKVNKLVLKLIVCLMDME
jgi:hypothetical protein